MMEWYEDELKVASETEDEDEVQGSEGRQRTIRKTRQNWRKTIVIQKIFLQPIYKGPKTFLSQIV